MCGRFTLKTREKGLHEAFPQIEFPPELIERYNVAPSQPVLAVTNDSPARAEYLRWGLIPSWARDASIGNRLINARADTLADKAAFRTAFHKRHCIVFADGFYEWRKVQGSKKRQPFYFTMRDGKPFAFAGLWELWKPEGSDEWIRTVTLITTEPNELVRSVHDRMPAVLPRERISEWLRTDLRPEQSLALLAPYPADEMVARPVSTSVNRADHEGADCIAGPDEPAKPSEQAQGTLF